MMYPKLSISPRQRWTKGGRTRHYWAVVTLLVTTVTINVTVVLCLHFLFLGHMYTTHATDRLQRDYLEYNLGPNQSKLVGSVDHSEGLGGYPSHDSSVKMVPETRKDKGKIPQSTVAKEVHSITQKIMILQPKTREASTIQPKKAREIAADHTPRVKKNQSNPQQDVEKGAKAAAKINPNKWKESVNMNQRKPQPSQKENNPPASLKKAMVPVETEAAADKHVLVKNKTNQQPSMEDIFESISKEFFENHKNKIQTLNDLSDPGKVPLLHFKTVTAKNDKDSDMSISWLKNSTNQPRVKYVLGSMQILPSDESFFNHSEYFVLRPTRVSNYSLTPVINSTSCAVSVPYLLIIIPSVDDHVKERDAIRRTWASPLYGGQWPRDGRNFTSVVKIVFFLGVSNKKTDQALQKESLKYGDIMQLNFVDNYRNLSLKMAAAFEWSVSNCAGVRHVMKVDEDTFVDLGLAVDVLVQVARRATHFVLGFNHKIRHPPVLRKGKWLVTQDLYPFTFYPRYLNGHSYVVSGDSVPQLARAWRHMPLVNNEDAYLTGILTQVMSITRIHCPWFAYESSLMGRCDLVEGRSVTQTKFKPYKELFKMWEVVKSGNCL